MTSTSVAPPTARPADGDGPFSDIERRLGTAREGLAVADGLVDRLGNVRLVVAFGALALVLSPLITRSGTAWWGLIPLFLVFVALGKLQDRFLEQRRVAAASVAYFEGSVARHEERWRGLPVDGTDERGRYASLPVVDDLDLFGPASLFQLLCRAVTAGGRRTLAEWLVRPAGAKEITARQEAVAALAKDVELRRRLYAAAATEEVGSSLADAGLVEWARRTPPIPAARLLRVLGIVQPALLIVAALWGFAFGGPREPFYLLALGQVFTLFATRRHTSPRADVLSGPERVLTRYARLIDVVESVPAGHSERLDALRATLGTEGRAASAEIRGLERLVGMLDARLNMIFALTLGPALLWELNVVLRSERWRERVGPNLEGWLAALGEVEALASLAAFAHERPEYGFVELVEGTGCFEMEGLRHPLIDRRRVVANDLDLGGPGSVLLLSGSNMSGKSTLLRSVGLAVVLAGAGAPVPATGGRMSLLRLATSVRVVDSLAQGASHFYAELARLEQVVRMSKEPGPGVLFLLDEVLHGTNSRERFIGAVSVVKWLAEAGAFGVVTTHDLSLTRLAEHLPDGAVTNRHFSDDVSAGELCFDYQLRDGPVESTNALRLMRAVGIDVELVES